ncbi:gibberellin 2-beta-dioxygenase 2 [Punica granatum]|uniref:Non-haem dioxygenase N-terminal domain-containing protein n=2 Tax=Punica granatum TaxID=22663 RepID=A0A218XR32_PUNGR|nr:gibberellin 2-beta-dioxygenase 2 [Punica granatum]OWM87413.1 hypothetical protein CDL15_Pgr022524 [Punica granatum]PKI46676.1 hypothetical protein CRG98_033018 [Punica granatum]
MASSARNPPTICGATAAPPPTPSALPSSSHLSTSGAADLLSGLLRRLPPTLSLPTRHRPPTATASTAVSPLPTLSVNGYGSTDFTSNLSSAFELGFFELKDHGIRAELALSAESDSLELFDLPHDQRESYFPRNWPLGYEPSDDEDGSSDSFYLDSQCSTDPVVSDSSLSLPSLKEFTRDMEQVGLQAMEWLLKHAGLDNPAGEDPSRLCSLLWVTRGSCLGQDDQSALVLVGSYPFVVGLSYQIRCGQKYLLRGDSGRVSVVPEVGSILVTIGDLAQVWSNGKLKKVRGRPIPIPCTDINANTTSTAITMSLLITLPLESTVCPLTVTPETTSTDAEWGGEVVEEEEEDNRGKERSTKKVVFSSFPFEDYAWRVYHERLSFKDPLDRYRI